MAGSERTLAGGRRARTGRRQDGYLVVDVETTGLDPRRDEVIQVAMIRVAPEGPVSWSSWIRPAGVVPDFVRRLTGVDPALLAAAPDAGEVWAQAAAFADGWAVVGHNARFDLAFLAAAGLRLPLAVDTLAWARIAFPRRSSYRLEDLADLTGWEGAGFHDARTDARVTAALVEALSVRLAALPRSVQGWLASLLGREWDWWEVADSQEQRPHPLLTPAPDPHGPAGWRPSSAPVPEPDTVIGRDGTLQSRHPGWQERPAQRAMARAAHETLAAADTLLVEAGTGVGKSLAYLLPALYRAAQGERVVIATHTLALQDQLWVKDLPEALAAMNLDTLPVALLKGRSRYVCLLKAEDLLMEVGTLGLEEEDRVALASFLVWLQETEDGEQDDWGSGRAPETMSVWERVQADVEACAGARCRFAGPCFLRRSRRLAQQSALVVTNHALLLSAEPGGPLPEFRHVVVDEAHRLPDAADQVLGITVSLGRESRRLYDAASAHGPLGRVTSPDLVAYASRAADRLKLAGAALARADEICRRLAEAWGMETEAVRLDEAARARWAEGGGQAMLAEAAAELSAADDATRELLEAATGVVGPSAVEEEPLWLGVGRLAHTAEELAAALGAFGDGDPQWVDWWESRGRRGDTVLRRAPLEPARLMRQRLWSRIDGGIVLTSATLTVGGRMDYMRSQLGVEDREPRALALPSPFAADRQALLALPDDAPDPRSPDHRAYCATAVAALATAAQGRTLVLTTSRSLLEYLGHALGPVLAEQGLSVLVQGVDGPAQRLVERLRREPRTVLMGTSSFWEGIDVAGPALSLVVVTRLPFAYPGDPLEAARAEWWEAQGVSPFWSRTLPAAVLRFQQGFGRLLRTESDRGAVVVLDPRVLPHRGGYGRLFLRSLPNPRWVRGSLGAVVEAVSQFLDGEDTVGADLADE